MTEQQLNDDWHYVLKENKVDIAKVYGNDFLADISNIYFYFVEVTIHNDKPCIQMCFEYDNQNFHLLIYDHSFVDVIPKQKNYSTLISSLIFISKEHSFSVL